MCFCALRVHACVTIKFLNGNNRAWATTFASMNVIICGISLYAASIINTYSARTGGRCQRFRLQQLYTLRNDNSNNSNNNMRYRVGREPARNATTRDATARESSSLSCFIRFVFHPKAVLKLTLHYIDTTAMTFLSHKNMLSWFMYSTFTHISVHVRSFEIEFECCAHENRSLRLIHLQ